MSKSIYGAFSLQASDAVSGQPLGILQFNFLVSLMYCGENASGS